MNKFVLNIISFGLLLLSINILLFIIVYSIYFKPYDNVNRNYKVYLLADSHGLPLNNLLEKYGVFNFSAGSDSYSDMLTKVKYLIKKSNVEKIIISLDDHLLSPYREKSNNFDRSMHFKFYHDFPDLYTYMRMNIKRYFVLLNPKSRDILKSFFISKMSGKQKYYDWDKRTKQLKVQQSRRRFRNQFRYQFKSNILTSSLEEIITTCMQNNIEIIGLKFPISHTYLNSMKNKSYHSDNVFKKNKLQIYDYKRLYIHKDNYFKDTDHLNELGAEFFADMLWENIFKNSR